MQDIQHGSDASSVLTGKKKIELICWCGFRSLIHLEERVLANQSRVLLSDLLVNRSGWFQDDPVPKVWLISYMNISLEFKLVYIQCKLLFFLNVWGKTWSAFIAVLNMHCHKKKIQLSPVGGSVYSCDRTWREPSSTVHSYTDFYLFLKLGAVLKRW